MTCKPTLVFKRTKVFVNNESYKSLKKLTAIAEQLEQQLGTSVFDAGIFAEVVERFRKNRIRAVERSIARAISGDHLPEEELKVDGIKDVREFCAFEFKPDMHAWGDLMYEALGNADDWVGTSDSSETKGITGYPWSKQASIEVSVSIPVKLSEASSFRSLERLVVRAATRHISGAMNMTPADKRPAAILRSYRSLFGQLESAELIARLFKGIRAIEARSRESSEVGGLSCWFGLECRGKGAPRKDEEDEREAFFSVMRATERRVLQWAEDRGGRASLEL